MSANIIKNFLKGRLLLMYFFQFFIWGSWLISLGGYMGHELNYTGGEIGAIYASMGFASLLMPGLIGVLADKYIAAEKLYAICHLLGAALLAYASTLSAYAAFYPVMFLVCLIYMPTHTLANTIAYGSLERAGLDIVHEFPSIRVWGTIGFILAMWVVDLSGWAESSMQLLLSAVVSLFLGLFAFMLPHCRPLRQGRKKGLLSHLGLGAIGLLRRPRIAMFFLFAILLGAALHITNTFSYPFLSDFSEGYADSFSVQHPNVLLSLSQISETLFLLLLPFFMTRFGIKRVMLISLVAWVLRFALFGLGDPDGGLVFLLLSMVVYGIAFDFFSISGSIFIDQETAPELRAETQGLFMVMTGGIGAILGGYGGGWVVDHYTAMGSTDWSTIWFVFAGYSLVVAVLFALFFRSDKQSASRSDS